MFVVQQSSLPFNKPNNNRYDDYQLNYIVYTQVYEYAIVSLYDTSLGTQRTM